MRQHGAVLRCFEGPCQCHGRRYYKVDVAAPSYSSQLQQPLTQHQVWNLGKNITRDHIPAIAVDQPSTYTKSIRFVLLQDTFVMVSYFSLAAVLATFFLSAIGMPTSLDSKSFNLLPRGGEGEPFTCPDPSGASSAKQTLLSFGAQPIGRVISKHARYD